MCTEELQTDCQHGLVYININQIFGLNTPEIFRLLKHEQALQEMYSMAILFGLKASCGPVDAGNVAACSGPVTCSSRTGSGCVRLGSTK